MVAFPPCKINLGLSAIRKRQDGFHDIETCFYPIPWTDIVEVIKADRFSFTCSGKDIDGRKEDNLCCRAYYALKEDYDLSPVNIHLHKIIPMGAGLGGGSSDAAHTLLLLNLIFSLNLSKDDLATYAARLGSDCAFFIYGMPMIGTGRGEILHQVSLSLQGKFIVIVYPAIPVSTADAYARVAPKQPDFSIEEIITHHPAGQWSGLLKNDFEDTVLRKYPLIGSIKDKLYKRGALYASMSGSGSSVFAIFDEETDIKDEFREFTCWSGMATL